MNSSIPRSRWPKSGNVIDATVATAQGVGDGRFGQIGFQAPIRRLDREDPSYQQ